MRKFNTRILSLLMALVMSFSLVITAFAYDIPDGYTVDEFGRVISYDGAEVIGYMDTDGDIMWFENSPYGAIGYMDANGNVVLPENNNTDIAPDVTVDVTPVENTDNYTQPDSIEVPTDDAFVNEDLALVTKFEDVKTTAWYYNDVTECAKLGIVAGFEDGTFRPEDKVTDVQWVTMITRTFYNSDVEAAAKSKPAGSPWYWANTKVASDQYLTSGMTIDGSAMNRYDMANVTKNVINKINNGVNKPSTAAQNAVPNQVKDWKSVPNNRTVAIKVCYATGVIAGMSDGKFHGEQNMTRAQACTVIMRMLKLINKYNPGDKDNDQYDDGKNQNTGNTGNNNQQTGSGKLANGQDATIANVQAILDQIKREYPTGTAWGNPDNGGAGNYYSDGPGYDNTRDVRAATNKFGAINLQYACGGWMAMVSERIFGKTGAPAREITDITKARPGDLVIKMNSAGNAMSHVGIFLQYTPANVTGPNGTTSSKPKIWTCDGNLNGNLSSTAVGTVIWDYPNTLNGGLNDIGTRIHILTRYPD